MAKRTEEIDSIIAEYCDYISDLAEDASLNEGSLRFLTEAGRPFTTSDLDVLISSLEKISNNIPREMKNTRRAITKAIDVTEDFYVNLSAGKRGYGKKEFAVLLSKIESLNDGLRAALRQLGGYTRLLQVKDVSKKMIEADGGDVPVKTKNVVKGGNVHKKDAEEGKKSPEAEQIPRKRHDAMYEPPPGSRREKPQEPAKDKEHSSTGSADVGSKPLNMRNFLVDSDEIEPNSLIKDMFKDSKGVEAFRNAIRKTFMEKADDGIMANIRSKLGMPSLTNWFGMSLNELMEDIEMLSIAKAQKLFEDLKSSPDPVPDGLAKQTFKVEKQDTTATSDDANKKQGVDVFELSAELDITPEQGRQLNSFLRKAGVKTVNYEKLKEGFSEEDTVILEHWRRLAGMIKEDK